MAEAPEAPSRRRRRLLSFVLAALVTGAVLWLLAGKVPPVELWRALGRTDPWLVALAAALSLALSTLQTAAMARATLRALGAPAPYAAVLAAVTSSLAIKFLLPASTGVLGWTAYLHRRHGVDAARGTLAVVAVLWMKLGWLIVLGTIGHVALGGRAAATLLAAALLVYSALTWLSPRALGLARGLRVRRIAELSSALEQAARTVRPAPLAIAALHALVSVLGELATFVVLLRAVGADAAPAAVLAYVPLVIMGAKVPVTLSGVGTRELLVVTLLAREASPSQLLAAALLASAVRHAGPAIFGVPFLGHFTTRVIEGRPR